MLRRYRLRGLTPPRRFELERAGPTPAEDDHCPPHVLWHRQHAARFARLFVLRCDLAPGAESEIEIDPPYVTTKPPERR